MVTAASRLTTGPDVIGCRPVVVTFEEFKDREEVLRKAGMLKASNNIHVTEDMSRWLYILVLHKVYCNHKQV